MTEHYDISSLQTMANVDAIRRTPDTYIETKGKKGVHTMLFEIVANSLDEALGGFCRNISVSLNGDGGITVADDGRGIPFAVDRDSGRTGVEMVLTTLYCGGKFSRKAYAVSGGTFGMGASIVNALSERLAIEVRRDGAVYRQVYLRGKPGARNVTPGDTTTGTRITFLPDKSIFEDTATDYDVVHTRLWEASCLLPGLRITLSDEAAGRSEEFFYGDFAASTCDYLSYCFSNRKFSLDSPVYLSRQKEAIRVETGIQFFLKWFDRNIFSFVNTVKTPGGGVHVEGFNDALTDCVIDLVKKSGEKKRVPSQADVLEGIGAILSIYVPNPKFTGPAKNALDGKEIKEAVYSLILDAISRYLDEHKEIADVIIVKTLRAYDIRNTVARVYDINRKGLGSAGGGGVSI